jgi:peptidoglycan/LPS O-acetylase OafA/YrhL
MNHIKALDSIRAFALFGVVMSHWLVGNPLLNVFNPGQIGVNTFFVLSGFLITGILLQNRTQAELSGNSKKVVVKNFFVRRSLRIFPIYYLTIFALLIFESATKTHIKDNFGYFLTYTSNFYFYKNQAYDGMISHLWSLAVEEQFYLVWPWVILFVPYKYLLSSILAFIGVGVISEYALCDNTHANLNYMLPFTSFASFGLGALLSFLLVFHRNQLPKAYRLLTLVAVACSLLLLGFILRGYPLLLPIRTVHSLLALWLIAHVMLAQERKQPQLWILDNRVLAFVGKISYGMYLYHVPLGYDYPYLDRYINWLFPSFVRSSVYYPQVVFVENFVLLVMLSWISWILLERPILNLKKYFDYQGTESTKVAAAVR